MVSDSGHDFYIEDEDVSTVADTRTVDLNGLAYPVLGVYGVDITVSGHKYPLEEYSRSQRHDYIELYSQQTNGKPLKYRVASRTGASTDEKDRIDTLDLIPTPDAVYTLTVWYLPILPDLDDDAEGFNGIAGWDEWVVWDVVIKTLFRDNRLDGNRYAVAVQERSRIEAELRRNAKRRNRSGPARRVDTRTGRKRRNWFARNPRSI